MLKYLFAVAGVLAFTDVLAQVIIIDSLKSQIEIHKEEDTTKVILLDKLSRANLGVNYFNALDLAHQSLKLAEQLSFRKGIASGHYILAHCYNTLGDADLAMDQALQAITLARQEGFLTILAESYRILAINYNDQQETDKAEMYIGQAEELSNQIQDWDLLSRVYNLAGVIQFSKKNYDSALVLYNKALSVAEEHHTSKFHFPQVFSNMGEVYGRQSNGSDREIYFFNKALSFARATSHKSAEAVAMNNLAKVYIRQNKYEKAEQYLLKSLQLSRTLGLRRSTRNVYRSLIDLKNLQGRYLEAQDYMKNYYDLKDSLQNEKKTRQIVELETRHESEKKDQAIQLLKRDRKIQQLWTNILIAVIILLVIVSAMIYFLQRYRERKNRKILNLEIDQLTTQHKELSEKFKDVLSSGKEKSIESHDQRLLKKAIGIVENNLSDPLFGVEKMAAEMGMSRTNMHRKIKAITGFPPSELIRSIRLRKAAVLLLNQADSIAQISFMVGFEDHSYFSKSFKKQFGVSPSEFLQSKKGL